MGCDDDVDSETRRLELQGVARGGVSSSKGRTFIVDIRVNDELSRIEYRISPCGPLGMN